MDQPRTTITLSVAHAPGLEKEARAHLRMMVDHAARASGIFLEWDADGATARLIDKDEAEAD